MGTEGLFLTLLKSKAPSSCEQWCSQHVDMGQTQMLFRQGAEATGKESWGENKELQPKNISEQWGYIFTQSSAVSLIKYYTYLLTEKPCFININR